MVNKKILLFLCFAIFLVIGSYSVLAATTLDSPIAFGNYSTSMLLNCTTSLNASNVSYNVTFYYNASGGATGTSNNLTATVWNNTAEDGVFNVTADISWLDDALSLYNISCYADNESNQEWSSVSNVTIDKTAPSAITLTESSSTKNSLTIAIAIIDATIGIDSSCAVEPKGGTSISGTTTSQTLTVTELNCGATYSYVVTCADKLGNSGSSSSTSFTTSSCSTGGAAASSATTFWTGGTTYVVGDEQFEQGYTKEVAVKNRMKVKVGTSYHYVGVKALTETTATVEIASDPIDVTLDIGEDAKIDVDNDGFYDIYVKLLDIISNKASLLVQKIYEEIPEGEGPVTTGGITEEEDEEAEEKNLTWLWILIGVVVLAVIVGGGIAAKKKK